MNWKFWKKKEPQKSQSEVELVVDQDAEKIREIFSHGEWAQFNLGPYSVSFQARDGKWASRHDCVTHYLYNFYPHSLCFDPETYRTREIILPKIDSDYQRELEENEVIEKAINFVFKHQDYLKAKKAGMCVEYPKIPYDMGHRHFDLFVSAFQDVLEADKE